MADRNFGNIIWTNHALQRLADRGIKQGDAWATWRNPDQSRYAATKGAWVFYKTYGDRKIEVVATQNERKQWVVMSVWDKPVYEKFADEQKTMEPLWKLVYRKIFSKKNKKTD